MPGDPLHEWDLLLPSDFKTISYHKMWAILYMCVCVWVCGVSASPLRAQREARLAKADEVNVLMYGVLQFSESLHHMYQSTEAKLARVARAISNTETVVQRLGQDTELAARTENQIKEGLSIIQVRTHIGTHKKQSESRALSSLLRLNPRGSESSTVGITS